MNRNVLQCTMLQYELRDSVLHQFAKSRGTILLALLRLRVATDFLARTSIRTRSTFLILEVEIPSRDSFATLGSLQFTTDSGAPKAGRALNAKSLKENNNAHTPLEMRWKQSETSKINHVEHGARCTRPSTASRYLLAPPARLARH